MLEYNGYVIEQSNQAPFYDVMVYKDGRFVMQASVSGVLEEEELKTAVDQMIELSRNFQKKQLTK